jgi:biopolymer transport protein TolQ
MVGESISFWSLIIQADWLVKLVMLLLLAASIWSWAIILRRINQWREEKRRTKLFERRFWSGGNLHDLYRDTKKIKGTHAGMSNLFVSGFKAFLRMKDSQQISANAILDDVQRSLRVALQRETERLDQGLAFLATVGSVSPYIGLFGTVWGIMRAFKSLGGVQQATLAMVAPGISEALIATAMGLFAAIPAVIAYNRFTAQNDVLLNHYENFQEEFVSIVHRQLHQPQHNTVASQPQQSKLA